MLARKQSPSREDVSWSHAASPYTPDLPNVYSGSSASSPSCQELPGLSEARVVDGAVTNAIPPATYIFRLYSGQMIELYGRNLYKLDGKLCEGAYTGDDFCDVSWPRTPVYCAVGSENCASVELCHLWVYSIWCAFSEVSCLPMYVWHAP